MQNVNRVIITGNLTRDPEMLQSSSTVCKMRVAVNGRRKNGSTGQWEDEANYFDVTCFGKQAENCSKYLGKGKPIAVDGRLSWHEWTTQDGQKRQAVEIIAETVQFLGDGSGSERPPATSAAPGVPVDTGDFESASNVQMAPADEDIPFAFPIVPLPGIDPRGAIWHR